MLVALSVVAAGCKQEVQFTRTPVAGALTPDAKASDTRVFLSIATNLAPALEAIESAVAQDVAKWREYVDDAACDRRKTQWLECMTANTAVSLTRDGPAEAAIEGSRLMITLPIKYEISAKGMGWAAYMSDTKVGRITVGVPFEVVLASGYRLDVRMGDNLVWSEKTADFLKKGKVYFAKTGDQRIKTQLKAAAEPLRQAIAAQPIRETTERAWKSLHTPIELSKGPSLWLRGLPEKVVGAGFAFEQGQFVYRIALDTKIAIHKGERPAPFFVNPLPEPQRLTAQAMATAAQTTSKTLLRLPFDVLAPGLEEAVAAAFPKTDLIETRADAKSTPVKVRPVKVQLFPARDRVALELQLDVVEPKRLLGMSGKAYLLGRPVLDRETGILELRDIGFPPAPVATRDAKTAAAATNGQLVRIGEEPFAGRFAAAARLNVTAPLESLLPRLNTQIRQYLDEQTEISGQFDAATIKSVEPIKGGFRFNLELDGVLALRSTLVRTPGGVMHQTGDVAPMRRP
jgi:hypothetical protein